MKHTAERYGIAFGWRTLETGRQQSVLRFARRSCSELLEVGFHEPLLMTAKSTLTGDLISGADAPVRGARPGRRLPQAGRQAAAPARRSTPARIPLGPGQEVARGSGGQTKEITPPVASYPTPITKEYVRGQWIKREWAALIEDGRGGPSLIDQTIAWSITTSKLIAVGDDAGEWMAPAPL
jgi:hypothetical protein